MFLSWLFSTPKITQEDLNRERAKIVAEQKYRRMYITPPPLSIWSEPTYNKKGYIKSIGLFKSNQDEIDRWHREHFDWMPDKK